MTGRRAPPAAVIAAMLTGAGLSIAATPAAAAGLLDWLATPIDPARGHAVDLATSWHGRLMVLAWCFLFPIGILAARFLKITPRQDWPRTLDNPAWWHAHRSTQYAGGVLMLAALGLALVIAEGGSPWVDRHHLLGWSVVPLAAVQFAGGWLRGSKGGPTAPARDGSLHGDHYDMTPRRRAFEHVHKSVGYLAVILAQGAVLLGLWLANAPRWMWIGLLVWWIVVLAAFALLQHRGFAVDTYQAIWGPGRQHPGNSRKPIGLGLTRSRQDLDGGTRMPHRSSGRDRRG